MMATAFTNPAIAIDAGEVQHLTLEGQVFRMSLPEILRLAQQEFLEDRTGVLPSEVCAVFRRGNSTIWVGQYSPCTRTVHWITDDSPSPFGPGATYSMRSIALPYVV